MCTWWGCGCNISRDVLINGYHITINIISICSNAKVHTDRTCYLNLTTIVKPLNIVRMRVWSCGERQLLHQLHASQVVATPSINNDANRTLFHHSLCVEQIMPLVLLGLRYLHT